MIAKPLLFTDALVRAILEGLKTETRRLVTVPWGPRGSPQRTLPYEPWYFDEDGELWTYDPDARPLRVLDSSAATDATHWYVREATAVRAAHVGDPVPVEYRADGATVEIPWEETTPRGVKVRKPGTWAPNIHMPRWACRIVLDRSAVGLERLQDITEESARAEGFQPDVESSGLYYVAGIPWASARDAFAATWDRIHHREGRRWADNPWVWVYEFTVAHVRLGDRDPARTVSFPEARPLWPRAMEAR